MLAAESSGDWGGRKGQGGGALFRLLCSEPWLMVMDIMSRLLLWLLIS